MHNKKEPVVQNKNILPYATRTLDPPISMVDRAREIEQADQFIQSRVNHQLEIIMKQIRSLQEEARAVMEKAGEDMNLHMVKCNFEKKPGMIIHLYQNTENQTYFSMLSPEEWKNPPHTFLGTYRVTTGMGFEKLNQDDSRD